MSRKRKSEQSSKNDNNLFQNTTKQDELDLSFISETESLFEDSDSDFDVKKIKLQTKVKKEPSVKIKKEPSARIKKQLSVKVKKETSLKIKKEPSVKVKKEHSVKVKKEPSVRIKKEPVRKTESNVCNWLDYNLLAEKENIGTKVAQSVITLFDSGNTIPFIARYRRDLIDDLPPEKLRDIKECYEDICSLKVKAEKMIKTIDKSGNLTVDIQNAIGNCKNLTELEHIYAPFKPKGKKTLAERAKNLGLDKPAQNILNGDLNVNLHEFVKNSGDEGIRNVDEVENSLINLVAHYIATNNEVLEFLREIKPTLNIKIETKQSNTAKKLENDENLYKFEQYFSFSIPVKFIKPHQTLAINRGENLKILSVKLVIPDYLFTKLKSFCERKWLDNTNKTSTRIRIFQKACDDAYKRIITPLIRRQTMNDITAEAEKASAQVFAENLKNLLLARPLKGKVIMGIDPGFQVGCKIAVISPCGEFIDHAVIYPHTRNFKQKDEDVVINLLLKHKCSLIALGNGKACRETEAWLTNIFKSKLLYSLDVNYTIVDESGASIYSCSEEAKKEFPKVDPLVISAISLARRIQDPLAELVKVDPKSLGVGMYQHDLHKKDIESNLAEVISECVSFVGVDLNTASHTLLKRVAGLSTQRANNILNHRNSNGPFTNRLQLKDVKGIGDKVFEQCAGFLRVGPANTYDAKEFYERPDTMPLDCTWVHPESYEIAEKLIEKFGLHYKQIGERQFLNTFKNKILNYSMQNLANEFKTTEANMKLICQVLNRPLDHDLRSENPQGPLFKREITSMDDIKCGIVLTGRVTNVTHFGAFVDIGVGRNGLIHNSGMRGTRVQLGQKVEVKVMKVEKEKSRIALELLRII